MKKIWICGASGMLGSHFRRLFTQKHIPFIGNDRHDIDVTHLDAVCEFVRTQKISHIINCAAYTQVDLAEDDQKNAYLANAIGPHHLGIAGRRHGARVLHFSTDYVFDGKKRTPYREDDLCSPINAYAMSKLAGEIKLLDEHPRSCIIRTSWLFGTPGRNFVQTMMGLMKAKEHVRVVFDQIGRPTYCQDLAEAALELCDQEGIFHFANQFETSWFQFAKEIHRQAKELDFPLIVKMIEPISTLEFPTTAKRPHYSVLNTNKIEALFGRALRPWQEALYDYLVSLKDNQTAKLN
ncbi:MAG: dTDP-4-dehydrorhamnose reductase [Parachlamydiaceae bacterium]